MSLKESEANKLPKGGISRREFLKIIFALTIGVSMSGLGWDVLRGLINFGEKVGVKFKIDEFLNTNYQSIENFPCFKASANYSLEQAQGNILIALGDSISAGYVGNGNDYHPATRIVVDKINQETNLQWQTINLAEVGAQTEDVSSQIDQISQNQALKGQNIDLSISVGGNDLALVLKQNFNEIKIDAILNKINKKENLSDNDIIYLNNLIDALNEHIFAYKNKMISLLEQIQALKQQGFNINHIFIQSLPNLGLAQELDFIPKKDSGEPAFTIQIDGTKVKQQIATAISQRLNLAMCQAIQEFSDKSGQEAIPTLFLNNFDLLGKNDLIGIHPNINGQDKMAKNELQRSFLINNGKTETLAQLVG